MTYWHSPAVTLRWLASSPGEVTSIVGRDGQRAREGGAAHRRARHVLDAVCLTFLGSLCSFVAEKKKKNIRPEEREVPVSVGCSTWQG